MKTLPLLSSVLTLAVVTATAQADIQVGSVDIPEVGNVRGNCDLMATNTVRATFKGLKDVPSAALDADAAASSQVAVFEVIENLAHRRHVRYGDGAMPAGMVFTVAMDRQMPGQPAEIVDTISQMQPGEETVMRIDHLFLYGEPDGKFLRPCARMARRVAIPAPTTQVEMPGEEVSAPTLPTTVAPLTGAADIGGGMRLANSRTISIRTVSDGQGGYTTQKEEVRKELIPGTNEVKTRMFINDEEVDPRTRRPLAPAPAPTSAPTPAPATPAQTATPAVTPAIPVPAPTQAPKDDTVVESDSF